MTCGHFCNKKVCEPCGDCNHMVDKVIPECLHTITLQCKQSTIHKLCNEKCERLLSCGHPCMDRCGAACDSTKCTMPSFTSIRSPCGHRVRPPCNVSRLFAKGEVQWEKLPQYCSTPCGATLACKHLCSGSCVGCAQGRLHQPCTQQCNQDNICGHQCQEPCNQICPPCKMPCEVKCIHSDCKKLCGESCAPCQHKCLKPCAYRLECGHVCGSYCHVTDDDPNHEKNICRKPCARAKAGCLADMVGDRGYHQCRKLCYEKCDDCDVQVDKVIPECLHTITLQCKQSTIHKLCNEKCERLLSCGHPCMDRCGAACDSTKCTMPSFTSIRSPCGHRVRPPCNVSRLFAKGEVQWEKLPQYCSTPCGATLACKHLCSGSCAGCAQGRLHQPCTQQCNQDNICGHQCQEPCNQICPPCKMPCEVKCIHSDCKKLCGEPCAPCQEQCSRACVHGACSRRCGEPCSRAPCSEQCARLRPCGHRCRGLCGEPCPDICKLCRPDEFPADFLGDQYEDTAKFIVLQDCDHVLEVDSMDCLMMGDQGNIQIRKCPFCRKVIINTNRYKDTVNKMFKDDINPIKLRVYGTQKEIQIKLTELQRKVDRFTEVYGLYFTDYLEYTFLTFISLLEVQKNVSLLEVEMECIYMNIFEMIVECWKTYESQTPKVTVLKDELIEHIKILLEVLKINPQSRIPIKISEQQQKDVCNEIKRLNVIVQLSKLLHLAKSTKGAQVTQQVERTKAVVFSLSVFNEDEILESLKELQKVIKINCGAAIGGAQHTLTTGNSHAPEMDGSRFAAWSEQANNMANFDHNNI